MLDVVPLNTKVDFNEADGKFVLKSAAVEFRAQSTPFRLRALQGWQRDAVLEIETERFVYEPYHSNVNCGP